MEIIFYAITFSNVGYQTKFHRWRISTNDEVFDGHFETSEIWKISRLTSCQSEITLRKVLRVPPLQGFLPPSFPLRQVLLSTDDARDGQLTRLRPGSGRRPALLSEAAGGLHRDPALGTGCLMHQFLRAPRGPDIRAAHEHGLEKLNLPKVEYSYFPLLWALSTEK